MIPILPDFEPRKTDPFAGQVDAQGRNVRCALPKLFHGPHVAQGWDVRFVDKRLMHLPALC